MSKKKLKDYLEFKKNPSLELFKLAQKMEGTISQMVSDALSKEIDVLRIQNEATIRSQIAQSIKESIFKNLELEKIKGEKGDNGDIGDKGDIGFKGNEGKQGKQGIPGKIGLTGFQGLIGKEGPPGRIGKNGLQGYQGFPGLNGKDGSPDTPQQIRTKLSLLVGDARLDAKFIKNLPMGQSRRTLHRGGMKMYVAFSLGTGDGATKTFTLPSTPYDTSQMVVYVGGGSLFVTDDFTLSGKVITLSTAAPSGAKVRVTMQGT